MGRAGGRGRCLSREHGGLGGGNACSSHFPSPPAITPAPQRLGFSLCFANWPTTCCVPEAWPVRRHIHSSLSPDEDTLTCILRAVAPPTADSMYASCTSHSTKPKSVTLPQNQYRLLIEFPTVAAIYVLEGLAFFGFIPLRTKYRLCIQLQ